MYHHEFTLISSKWMFRLEDMTKLEQKLWSEYLERDGFRIDDMREIFTPFDGEQAIHLNEDVGTQELRVCTWNWIDSAGTSHTILDINGWPGDNESGVIAIDGEAIMTNGDQDLSLLEDIDDPFNFSEREALFYYIRKGNDCQNMSDDELNANYNAFFDSESGINIEKLETTALNDYHQKLNAIHEEHNVLCEKHLSEFKYIDQSGLEDYTEIADRIGYKLVENWLGEFDKHTVFKFIEWKCENFHRNLVTVHEHYDTNTYILDDNVKIGMMIYKKTYLSDNFDITDPIMDALAPRIHSYFHMIRNYKISPIAKLNSNNKLNTCNMFTNSSALPSIPLMSYGFVSTFD